MYLFWVPASLPGFLDPHVIISVIPRKWREEITVEFHVAWICKAKFELSWVNVFCIVYTLVFLRRVILLCRPILEAMCIVVFQSSLSEYERFLPSWNYCRVWSSCQPSLNPFFSSVFWDIPCWWLLIPQFGISVELCSPFPAVIYQVCLLRNRFHLFAHPSLK